MDVSDANEPEPITRKIPVRLAERLKMSFPIAVVVCLLIDPTPGDGGHEPVAAGSPVAAADSDRSTEQPSSMAETIFAGDVSTPAGDEPGAALLDTGRGFLFVGGQWVSRDLECTWSDGVLRADLPETQPDADSETDSEHALDVTSDQFARIARTLRDGGLVLLSDAHSPWCLPLSSGGFEVLETLLLPPDAARQESLNRVTSSTATGIPGPVEEWLASYQPVAAFRKIAFDVLSRARSVEDANLAAASAFRRFDNWNYPVTLGAMLTCVFAFGSLISVRPAELVSDQFDHPDAAIHRFLLLIVAMSGIDLVWTVLAHQARVITEVNPLGSLIIDDPLRLVLFKVLATTLAVGILYRARNVAIARKVCWWSCLTLALLTARWVIISGVTI